jgi:hypothetical protein
MYIELLVDAVHPPGVKENQHHKDQNRALLRKPEPQLETRETDGIQLLNQQNAKTETADKPNCQTTCHQTKVGTPVVRSILSVQYALQYP